MLQTNKFLFVLDEECKKRWKHIRDSYNRFKRKRKCTTGSAAQAKHFKWSFYERMRFLEMVSQERNTECSIIDECTNTDSILSSQLTNTAVDEHLDNDNQQQKEDNGDLQPNEETDILGSPKPKKSLPARPSMYRDEFLQVLKKREENRQKLMGQFNQTKEDNDEDSTFANHIKTVLKKISPRLKIQAKNEIYACLTKYETLNLDLQESRSSPASESRTSSTFSPLSVTYIPESVESTNLTVLEAPPYTSASTTAHTSDTYYSATSFYEQYRDDI